MNEIFQNRVKELFHFLLLAGHEMSEDMLIPMLVELSDLSGISGEDDFKTLNIEFDNDTTLFVSRCLELFSAAKNDEKKLDKFIEFYKQELLSIENYEIITFLEI